MRNHALTFTRSKSYRIQHNERGIPSKSRSYRIHFNNNSAPTAQILTLDTVFAHISLDVFLFDWMSERDRCFSRKFVSLSASVCA